jgi:hypothetical protein
MRFPLRANAGLGAAAVLSIWGAIAYFGFETAFNEQNRDPYQTAAQAARLADLRASVPEDAVLGYLTDLEPGSLAASTAFNVAQYALAPRLLMQDAGQAQVFGNFAHPADFAALGREHGLRVERDFGAGVVLFRKEARP